MGSLFVFVLGTVVRKAEWQHGGLFVRLHSSSGKRPPDDAKKCQHSQRRHDAVKYANHAYSPALIMASAAAARDDTPKPCKYATMASSSVLPTSASGALSICSCV